MTRENVLWNLTTYRDTLKSNHNISDLSGSSVGKSQEVAIAFKANILSRYEMRMLLCFLILDEMHMTVFTM